MMQEKNTLTVLKLITEDITYKIMIKLLKMINLYGFWRVMKNPEYYHRKYDGKSTKGYYPYN